MSYSYRIEQAIRAAAVLHKDQQRKGSIAFPYVTHLFAVAMLVADYTDDEDVIIGALLHDTLEDTDYTAKELQDDFGGTVRDIVCAVTEPKKISGEKLSWKGRKKAYVEQLKDAPDGALMVSAADKIHNMRSIVEEYYDKHDDFLSHFGGSLDDRVLMYENIAQILNSRLENEIITEFNHVFNEYKNFIKYVRKEQNAF